MKVLDLRCSHDHRFEGWFASEDDFRDQCARGLVECPVCADASITRLPSAPRIQVNRAQEVAPPQTATSPEAPIEATLQSAWMKAVKHVMENTVDVGERFAEEARRIHYGETDERAIRGRTTADEAQALRDEGIEIASLPVPVALKDSLQ